MTQIVLKAVGTVVQEILAAIDYPMEAELISDTDKEAMIDKLKSLDLNEEVKQLNSDNDDSIELPYIKEVQNKIE